jgi:hypothetical protein
MQLSRSWCRLLFFWVGIGTLCGVGVATLEILGPAGRDTRVAAESEPSAPVVTDARQPPEPVSAVGFETTQPTSSDATTPEADAISPRQQTAIAVPSHGPAIPPRREPVVAERTLHLRVFRDNAHCPRTPCYKWHLIEQRLKSSRHPTLDLAKLPLAPSIREAAEKGQVDLIVDAVEQHRSINGHDTVIMVATSLAGVMPHDGQ